MQVRTEQLVPAPQVQPASDTAENAGPIDASLLDIDLDSLNLPAVAVLDAMTPRATQVTLASNRSIK